MQILAVASFPHPEEGLPEGLSGFPEVGAVDLQGKESLPEYVADISWGTAHLCHGSADFLSQEKVCRQRSMVVGS